MAQTNLTMKAEVDALRKQVDSLLQQLETLKKDSVSMVDVDECYSKLRKERSELMLENERLKQEIASLNYTIAINNTHLTQCNHDTNNTLNFNN